MANNKLVREYFHYRMLEVNSLCFWIVMNCLVSNLKIGVSCFFKSQSQAVYTFN